MKRILQSIVFLGALTILLNSCFYDEVVVFEGLPKNASLKNDLQPIFDRDCNLSGCHDEKSTHEPSLVSANSYNALLTGGFVNTLDPEKSVLYIAITEGGMPEGRGALSTNEKKIILGWITDGAKNN